jgi:predicted MFS family arabinose efflux permease
LVDDQPQRGSDGRILASSGGRLANCSVHVARWRTDIIDSRWILIAVEIAIVVVIAAFAMLVSFGLATPAVLLLTIFLLSAGFSLTAPARLSITPLLVTRAELDSAIAANGVGYNISRAVGPALAGLVITGLELPHPSGSTASAISYSSLHCYGGARLGSQRKGHRPSV